MVREIILAGLRKKLTLLIRFLLFLKKLHILLFPILKPLDLLNEEVIRNVLKCVDKKKLQKNVETGRTERDGKVFVDAARWLGFYGESWIKNEGKF